MQHAAAYIALTVDARWSGELVEDGAAGHAGQASDHALHQQIEIDHELQHDIDGLAQLEQQFVECLGLIDVAREAVEDEAVVGVGPGDAFTDHADHDVVGYQLAGVHHGLGLTAQRGLRGDSGTQQVTGGDLWHVVLLGEVASLSALT